MMRQAYPKLIAFLRGDLGTSLVVALIWQTLLVLAGAFFDITLKRIFQNPIHPDGPLSIFDHTMLWDGAWYLGITQGTYLHPHNPSAVFFPLFPLLTWAIHHASFGLITYPIAGFIVNILSLAIAVFALKKISGFFLKDRHAWWPVVLFLTSPAAFFLHAFYTESLFCALGFLSYYFALKKQWVAMGICLAFLSATRVTAALFVGLCALEYLRAHSWNIRTSINKNVATFLLAPLGFIVYGVFLHFARGDFLSMFHSLDYTKDWVYHVFNPNIFETYAMGAERIYGVAFTNVPFDEGQVVSFFLPIASLVILYACSIYTIAAIRTKSIGIPLGVFGIASAIFYSLNSNFVSVHRYVLPCLVIYVAVSHFVFSRKHQPILLYTLVYAGIILQSYLLIMFVSGYFAG